MLRLRKVALFATLAAGAWVAAPAQAQTAQPAPQDPTTTPYDVDHPAQSDVNITVEQAPADTTKEPAPAQQNITVQPAPAPAPIIVEQPAPAVEPAPVVVEQPQPVHVTIKERKQRSATISVGGGVADFTNSKMRDRTGLNAAYEARLSVGINAPLALEAAYVGTAADINTLGLDDDAMLISNGVEGLARLNLGSFDFQPYVVGGASWVRYNVVNDSFNTSDVRDKDDVLAVPLGGGVSTYLGESGLMLDARFTYRMMFDEDIDRALDGDRQSSLDNWMATLKLGYAF